MNYALPEFEQKDVVFIGKGKEGESFERFIQTFGNVRSFRFVDQKDDPNYLENLKNLDFTQTVIVKTPGCPGRLVPAPYTTSTKVFFDCVKQLGAKTIGVTGTKGKTTTASLVAHILRHAHKPVILAGNMGSPMLDTLQDATPDNIFVLELSSYQLNELEVSPDIAVITNLYRDHIDYHGSLEQYWEAKHNIVRYMTTEHVVVFNPETEVVLHWLAESDAKQAPINPGDTVDMTQAKLIGDHNRVNFLLAFEAVKQLGVERLSALAALKTFEPIRHRLEKVREVRGITFIDDAIASQPEAAVAGITACVRDVGPVGCVLLGGQDRDYDFTELVHLLHTLLIPKLVLFPDTGQKIKELLPETYQPEIFETSDMAEAVHWAAENCPSGSVCLLSSAAPSYSLWSGFEEKGSLFQQAVLGLSNT